MRPEKRRVAVEEIFHFVDAGCCGTAAVITPVGSITWGERKVEYVKGEEPGEYCRKLYGKLTAIQLGEEPDTHNWCRTIAPDR